MLKRWVVYLAVLGCSIGLYVGVSVWWSWVLLLTVAVLPLFSVVLRFFGKGEYDSLGLFRFPVTVPEPSYEQVLRPYRPGDSPSRVHWKLTAKTGALTVWEERAAAFPRPESSPRRGVITVALCLGAVFCLFPPGKYSQQMAALRKLLLRPVGQAAFVDLTAVGPVAENRQAVLDVVATQAQVLYLRGQAFDTYDGKSWSASNSAGKEAFWSPVGSGEVQIAARSLQGIAYFPYGGEYRLTGGALENADGLLEYTYRQRSVVPSAIRASKQCLQLPSDTESWAKKVLDQLLAEDGLTETEKVEKIQNFVRNCAKYDKNTPKMSGETDFARWFVENGRGYCVHFATAAAVLLRCAGIPARFVTGYAVAVQAGVRKTVVGSDAHAWVEYLSGGVWCILEATPTTQVIPPAEIPADAELAEEREGKYGGLWVLLGMVIMAFPLWRCVKRRLGQSPGEDVLKMKALAQKAAYSRDGLTPEEEQLFADLQKKSKGFSWE